ncbi:hypothetical protein WJX72_001766 [[Myrmecia] bisecta]|uniref:Uncharacterized protein n=1 Tax=[Myrmecia] bisecta TaxID=41462 RepID=A0AAW1PE51_9CHLO
MMQGSVAEDGQPLGAGHFRTKTASAGTGQVYLDPGLIADRTAKYVAIYNRWSWAPWRLLVAYALMGGVPFPLPLADGHHKSRNHYQHVVLHYAKFSDNTRLQHFILECLHHKRWRTRLVWREANAGDLQEQKSVGYLTTINLLENVHPHISISLDVCVSGGSACIKDIIKVL